MKKIILIPMVITLLIVSCSEDTSEDRINAEKYGVSVRSNISEEITFSYKFSNYDTGEIFHQGEKSGSGGYVGVTFPVTEKELSSTDNILVHIEVTNNPSGNIYRYYHSIQNSKYLKWENNPNAATIFEMNPIDFDLGSGVYEGSIPIKALEKYWRTNTDWSN